jgi:hypothetical protein
MAASSRARLVDPLAEDEVVAAAEPRPPGGADGQQASDLVGIAGTDAVERVRAAGLLAAIQAVDGEPSGTVLGQDPPAGTPVAAGAVVTLQVAAERERGEPSIEPAVEALGVGEAVDGDDTAEWFAALAAEGAGGEGEDEFEPELPVRRKRKHRQPSPPLQEREFPAAPDPLPSTTEEEGREEWLSPEWFKPPGRSLLAGGVSRRARRAIVVVGCGLAGLLVGVMLASGGERSGSKAPAPPVAGDRPLAQPHVTHASRRLRSHRHAAHVEHRTVRRGVRVVVVRVTTPAAVESAPPQAAPPPPGVERAALEFQSP